MRLQVEMIIASESESAATSFPQAGAELAVRNVDEDAELAMEFGDRVPVVVIDGEEFACWEVDNAELAAELSR